jgi:DNA-binding response OmpR family regulator
VVTLNAPPTIAVVEDDPEIRRILRAGLESEKINVREAASGAELMHLLGTHPVDLITLDLTLGNEDGLVLARELRTQHNIPIIMITAKGDMVDRVVGLEVGADDYIAKPFHMREILARVRAVLRRYDKNPPARRDGETERYEFERWTIDIGRRELSNPEGEAIELTTAEFNLLSLLIKRPCRVFTRDEIMDGLKGHEWTPLDRTIDALVARLRKKIEPRSETPRVLKTVRGVGYAFAVDARRI